MKLIDNLDKEISGRHFLSFQDFSEIKLLESPDDDGFCYKCGKQLTPLTYLDPEFYYQPCWGCVTKRKIDRDAIENNLFRAIHEFYSKIIGDRYYQLFLVDDIYPHTTFPHTFKVFKKVVNSLDPPSRNDFWFLDWVPGFPKIISIDNLPGIKIVNLTRYYNPIEVEKGENKITVAGYDIIMPEFTTFDVRHHSRYSVLNKNGDRRSKRIKIGDKCMKFYNTAEDGTKSIFKIMKGDEPISIRSISYQDLVIIKLAIMRNKSFLKLILEVLEEVCKGCSEFRDTVFLKNTVYMNPKKASAPKVTVTWTELSKERLDNEINISIL